MLTGSGAFYAGIKWEKADRFDDAQVEIDQLTIKAKQALIGLNNIWAAEANRAEIEIDKWTKENQATKELIESLLKGQADISERFNEIKNEITLIDHMGTCDLSPAAVSLLRQAVEASGGTTPVSGDIPGLREK